MSVSACKTRYQFRSFACGCVSAFSTTCICEKKLTKWIFLGPTIGHLCLRNTGSHLKWYVAQSLNAQVWPNFNQISISSTLPANSCKLLQCSKFPNPSSYFSGAFAELRKATISFVMTPSVRPPEWNYSAPIVPICMTSDILVFFKICPEMSSFIKIGQE